MSLINQMLNELEKRGENAVLADGAVRAIPPRKPSNYKWYAMGTAVAVLVVLIAMQWNQQRGEAVAVVPVAIPDEKKFELVSSLTTDVGAASSVPVPVPVAEPAVVVLPGTMAPVSRLSLELSAIPPQPDKPASVESTETAAEGIRKTPTQRETQQQTQRETSAPVKIPSTATTAPTGRAIDPIKQISPRQRAESEFNKAALAEQQGLTKEAIAGYEEVLRLDPLHHAARHALVSVLLSLQRNADAERLLQEGLKREMRETSFAMLLARLQVEREEMTLALETLEKSLPYADRQPEYHAFIAALLQRQDRHKEAITHYQIALQLVPGNGIWWMGAGMSMQAVERVEDARDAYQRALATQSLSAELAAYVQSKLKELGG